MLQRQVLRGPTNHTIFMQRRSLHGNYAFVLHATVIPHSTPMTHKRENLAINLLIICLLAVASSLTATSCGTVVLTMPSTCKTQRFGLAQSCPEYPHFITATARARLPALQLASLRLQRSGHLAQNPQTVKLSTCREPRQAKIGNIVSMSISRRSFLTAAAATAATLQARLIPVVGVQLYTVRQVLPQRPLETLRAIEEIGYREVECTADHLDDIWPMLKKTSLRPVSVHINEMFFIHQPEKLPAALDDAKRHDFEYVVCPWIEPRDRGGVEMIRKLGQTLNTAGEMCRKSGMQLCYHNHAFEYQPTPEGRLLDVLMKSTDPKLVGLELDVMWAHVGGADPVAVLKQYGDRIPLVHLKNVARGVESRFNENIPRDAFHDLSDGAVDIAAVIRTAKETGVKHYFVEQDETPGNPIDSLRKSYKFLESLS